jgi:hypothetical protein
MNDKLIRRITRQTFEDWNGEGSWVKASNWRKSDWRKLISGAVADYCTGDPSYRPYRADATDPNPED